MPMTRSILPPLVMVLSVFALVACNKERNTWPSDGPPPETEAVAEDGAAARVVLFAPVAAAPITEVHPEAPITFARDLASRMDLLLDNHDAWVGETLPASDDVAWDAGPVGSARGANVIVLTTIKTVEEDAAVGVGDPMCQATVYMKAIDGAGVSLWQKEWTAKVINRRSPKLNQPGAHPRSKAAWEASKKCLMGLMHYLSLVGEDLKPRPDTEYEPQPEVLIDLVIDSNPPNANIHIDGVFRGTTPTKVPVPVREITVKLSRQNFQVWEMKLTPESGMQIKPALEAAE